MANEEEEGGEYHGSLNRWASALKGVVSRVPGPVLEVLRLIGCQVSEAYTMSTSSCPASRNLLTI